MNINCCYNENLKSPVVQSKRTPTPWHISLILIETVQFKLMKVIIIKYLVYTYDDETKVKYKKINN